MKKLSLEYPVVVEGKYDKIKLDAIVATPIITLDGFSFFNDKKKQQLFKSIMILMIVWLKVIYKVVVIIIRL